MLNPELEGIFEDVKSPPEKANPGVCRPYEGRLAEAEYKLKVFAEIVEKIKGYANSPTDSEDAALEKIKVSLDVLMIVIGQ